MVKPMINHEPKQPRASTPEDIASVQYRMEEVAKRTGLTPRAIRYYEEMGLLRPSGRTAGGFRLFTDADIAQLVRINELQTLLGFSLAEIKQTLQVDAMRAEVREAYHGTTDPHVRNDLLDHAARLVQSQIEIIDERIGRLAKLRAEHAERLDRVKARQAELVTDQPEVENLTADRPQGAHRG
jgi:DNA-binding transcriptional MerR regulator